MCYLTLHCCAASTEYVYIQTLTIYKLLYLFNNYYEVQYVATRLLIYLDLKEYNLDSHSHSFETTDVSTTPIGLGDCTEYC